MVKNNKQEKNLAAMLLQEINLGVTKCGAMKVTDPDRSKLPR